MTVKQTYASSDYWGLAASQRVNIDETVRNDVKLLSLLYDNNLSCHDSATVLVLCGYAQATHCRSFSSVYDSSSPWG